jgi:hypothetical protein
VNKLSEAGSRLKLIWKFAENVKKVSPWFFNLRDLVSNRPNLVPHGLGNNDSQIDSSILLASSEVDSEVGLDSGWAASDLGGMGSPTPATDDTDGDDGSDDEADSFADAAPKSRKCKQTPEDNTKDEKGKSVQVKPAVKLEKKTGPRAGTSNVAQPAAKKAKMTIMDKFSAVSVAEEETIQQQLELKKIKASGV